MRLAVLLSALLVGCTSTQPEFNLQGRSPQSLMAGVATQVQACWFRSRDKRFRNYSLSPELNSYAGRPRILLVPRRRQTSLPVLVAQAERTKGQVVFSSFGPLINQPGGEMLRADLLRWANGARTC